MKTKEEVIYDKTLNGQDMKSILGITLPLNKITIIKGNKEIYINPLVIGMKPNINSRFHIIIKKIDVEQLMEDKEVVQSILGKLNKEQKIMLFDELKKEMKS